MGNRNWIRCSALTTAITLAFSLVPVPADADAPPEPAEPSPDQFDPVPIEAPPEPVEPEPAPPPPKPEPAAVEPPATPPEPALPVEGPAPQEVAKLETMRRASLGLMSTGGAVVTVGLGMTIAFTLLGHREQNFETPVHANIQHMDSMARVGGILLASGFVLAAVGAVVFTTTRKKAELQATARVRVTPAIGGLVVSGRF